MTRPPQTIEIRGSRDEPDTYEIRDFLKRSGIKFDWRENSEPDSKESLVTLTDGKQLANPTLDDVAKHLGLVVKPTRKEYDISIYGAGPAGLSAAVYAASEGLVSGPKPTLL